jgi:hypothetical protein
MLLYHPDGTALMIAAERLVLSLLAYTRHTASDGVQLPLDALVAMYSKPRPLLQDP